MADKTITIITKIPRGCQYCRGTIAIRTDGIRYWTHCYQCHFERDLEDDREPPRIRTPEDGMRMVKR